ncbi:phosphoglycerol transferase [Streptococcus massiliensis]|uniref:Phosphoglycerol transferase n=1 Tax=Streptococcus massiliensis TaxID=313439 RepID=A0A380KX53_9STRE|nr:hypothetical protein [Streptococcus massiliensis]SUN75667.1 phosphoglycerol transferase [Streptococcus massiliensis]
MQNHAVWQESNPPEITAEGKGFADDENDKLRSYTHLLRHTDNATKDFFSKLSQLNKK